MKHQPQSSSCHARCSNYRYVRQRTDMPHENAVQIMIDGRGAHFDADMFDAFIDIQEEFRAIARRFADSVRV